MTQLLVDLIPVEGLREAPAGVDARGGAQSAPGLPVVPAVLPRRIGRERRLDSFEEDDVVQAGPCRAAERHDARNHLGIADRPLVGLAGAPGPAGPGGEP